jgi:hypothetical protein
MRTDDRLAKLIGNKESEPPIPKTPRKSIESELEFYNTRFKGGKTKCVRNRISRLEYALDNWND